MLGARRPDLEGLTLDGLYRVGEPVGSGSTGVVLAATRISDERDVVIKVLRRELAHRTDLAARLMLEAEAARAIRHPGVVPCLDQGRLWDGSPYVVFERLRGESLLRLIRRRGPMRVPQLIAVAYRITKVLAAVHRTGYVHRDLKSEHIWLASDRGALQVSLLDFGVCQPPVGGDTRKSGCQVFGTPGYLAPEQAAPTEPATERSDLYGLGATLFEALTVRPPFAGPSVGTLLRLALSEEAPSVSRFRAGIPRALERLVRELLARDPNARPLNTRVVERALSSMADTPFGLAEAELASELVSASDTGLIPTLDEGRPTRAPAFFRAAQA